MSRSRTWCCRRRSTGRPRPDDVMLLVEVSGSTLDYDRDVKRSLYARAGLPEVWIVNLDDQ